MHPMLMDIRQATRVPYFIGTYWIGTVHMLIGKGFATGGEPRSSGYGKRLKFQRSWVRFSALYTGWTFFTFICCKNCKVCLKRPKINEKEAGVGPF